MACAGWIGVFGGLCTLSGIAMAWSGDFGIGCVFVISGVALMTTAGILATESWSMRVDDEIDRWERNQMARWSPECPTHGDTLCVVRNRDCPSLRRLEE